MNTILIVSSIVGFITVPSSECQSFASGGITKFSIGLSGDTKPVSDIISEGTIHPIMNQSIDIQGTWFEHLGIQRFTSGSSISISHFIMSNGIASIIEQSESLRTRSTLVVKSSNNPSFHFKRTNVISCGFASIVIPKTSGIDFNTIFTTSIITMIIVIWFIGIPVIDITWATSA